MIIILVVGNLWCRICKGTHGGKIVFLDFYAAVTLHWKFLLFFWGVLEYFLILFEWVYGINHGWNIGRMNTL